MEQKKRRPLLGFIGLTLLVCGFGGYGITDNVLVGALGIVGIFVLIYALFFGHVKTLG